MRFAAILAALLAILPLSPLSAAELVPHEATYSSTLEKYHGPGELQAWEGSMRYSVSRDCQKWKLVKEFVTRFTINGTDSEIRAISTIYEALDGNRIEFNARAELNGQTVLYKKGSAKLQGKGMPGVATYREPAGETLELPAGTIFIVASWLASIDQTDSGKKKWKQLVFNDGELTDLSYTVRKRGVAASASPSGDANLISQTGWLVDGKFHGRQSGVNVQSTALEHANGVTSLIVQNNDIFATRYELVDIRALPAPQC